MRPDKIFVGFVVLFLGFSLLTVSSSTEYGGVILIGPFPIVFGSSPEMASSGILVAMIILVIMYLTFRGFR